MLDLCFGCVVQVLDDPKLLRQSLKEEQKQRQKSAKKWWVLHASEYHAQNQSPFPTPNPYAL